MTCCSPLKMIKQDLLRFPTFFWTDLCVKTLGFFLKLTSYKLVSNRNSKTIRVSSFYLNIENLCCSNAWFSIGPKSVTEPQVNVISTNNLFWFSYASLFVYSMFFSCLFFLNANVLLLLFFLGALGVFYGNKTSSQFVSFSSMVHLPGDLNTHILSVKGAHVVVEFKQNIHSNGNRKRQKMSWFFSSCQ